MALRNPETIVRLTNKIQGNLTNLKLSNNQLTGEIPEIICNFQFDWNLWGNDISNNNFCPPYPECLSEEDIGYQDTSECEEECILGDVNNDSLLDVLDIVSMINQILNGEYSECSDTNSDGELNILDVVTLVNFIFSSP